MNIRKKKILVICLAIIILLGIILRYIAVKKETFASSSDEVNEITVDTEETDITIDEDNQNTQNEKKYNIQIELNKIGTAKNENIAGALFKVSNNNPDENIEINIYNKKTGEKIEPNEENNIQISKEGAIIEASNIQKGIVYELLIEEKQAPEGYEKTFESAIVEISVTENEDIVGKVKTITAQGVNSDGTTSIGENNGSKEGIIEFANEDENGEVVLSKENAKIGLQYKLGEEGTWTDYTGALNIEENTTVYARSTDGENYSGVSLKVIDNIDKIAPTIVSVQEKENNNDIETSVDISLTDNASGIVGYAISKTDTVEPEYTSVNQELELQTTIGEISENGTYYLWVKDAATNVTVQAFEVTGVKDIVVAKIISASEGYEELVNTEYYTLEEAIETCPTEGTATIQILHDIYDESNVIDGKTVTLDLNGFTVQTRNKNKPTITVQSGNFTVINSKITGGLTSNNTEAVVIEEAGVLNVGADDKKITISQPALVGKDVGVRNNNGTFNFYDGNITAKSAIYGKVSETPPAYSVSVVEGEKTQTASLAIISDVEARIGRKTYTMLEDAITDAGTKYGTDGSQVEIILVQDLAKAETVVVDETKNIKLDLDGHILTTTSTGNVIKNYGKLEIVDGSAGNYEYKIEAEKSNIISGDTNWSNSSFSGGYGVDYAKDLSFDFEITESGPYILTVVGKFLNRESDIFLDGGNTSIYNFATAGNSDSYSTVNIVIDNLEIGNHTIRFYNSTDGYSPIYDYFKISNNNGIGKITSTTNTTINNGSTGALIGDVIEYDLRDVKKYNENDEYCFEYDVVSQQLINTNNTHSESLNTSATGYMELDLTDCENKMYTLTIDAEISTYSTYGYGYVSITNNPDNTTNVTNTSYGRFIQINGKTSSKDYTLDLAGGQKYYLNFRYTKSSRTSTSYDDEFRINSIVIKQKQIGMLTLTSGTIDLAKASTSTRYSAIYNDGLTYIQGGNITSSTYTAGVTTGSGAITNVNGGNIKLSADGAVAVWAVGNRSLTKINNGEIYGYYGLATSNCLANAIVTGGNFSTNCYHQIFNDGIYSLITLDGVTLSKSTNGYNVTKNATYADIEINNSNIANMNSYAIYNNANYGNIKINNTIISGANGIYDYSRCNININESNITTSGRAIYIYNRSDYSGMSFDIVNSTIDVTGNERVIYIERPNNNLNIKSSKLSNTNSSSNFEAIHMTGGSINILGDTVVKTGGAAIYSNTTYNITINIESGTLESKVWQAIEMPNTPGKITLGKKDGTINESPILKSSLTARTINANNMALNFYDGKLIGAKNNIIGVTINELEEDVDIISNMNEDGYEEITLGIPTEYVAEIVGGEKYTTVQDAIDACSIEAGETKTTINLLKDISTGRTMTIKEGQNITIDSCENDVYAYANPCILNEGNVEFKNTQQFKYENTYDSLVNNGTYYFENQDGKWINNNKGVHSSVANSYVEIDLSDLPGVYALTVNAEISSESSCDIGYAIISDTTTAPQYSDTTNKFIYISGTVSPKDYIQKLEGEKKYYLHIGYRKDGSANTGSDYFTINNINIQKTVSGKFISNRPVILENKETATVSDENVMFDGDLYGLNDKSYIDMIKNTGILNIENGTIDLYGNYSRALNNSESGIINISGGIINSSVSSNYMCTILNQDTAALNISGGKISVKTIVDNGTNYGIYNSGSGVLNITGGELACSTVNYSHIATCIYNGSDNEDSIVCENKITIDGCNATGISNGASGILKVENVNIDGNGGTGSYGGNMMANCIFNTGKITLTNSNLSGRYVDQIENSGIMTIENCEIIGKYSNNTCYAIQSTGGTMYINNSNIGGRATGVYTAGNATVVNIIASQIAGSKNGIDSRGGTINIDTDISTIVTGDNYGIYNAGGAINLGVNDENVNIESPYVKGINTNGVYNTGTFNFYDGKIEGPDQKSISGIVNNKVEGYQVVKTANTETSTEVAILQIVPIIEIEGIGQYASIKDLQKALNELDTVEEYKVNLLKDVSIDETEVSINIKANLNTTLDLNGFTINASNTDAIVNNGNLKITDSSEEATGKIVGIKGTIINNTGNLTIEKGTYYYSGENISLIVNKESGNINWVDGTLTLKTSSSYTQYGIYTESIGEINIEDIKFITSGYDPWRGSNSVQYLLYSVAQNTSTINVKNITGELGSGTKYFIYDYQGKANINLLSGEIANNISTVYQNSNNGGVLTISGEIVNGSISHGCVKQIKNSTINSISCGSSSDFIFENSTVTTFTNYGNGIVNSGTISSFTNYGNITINDATITSIINGTSSYNATMYVNGGTINNTNGVGIVNYSGSTLTLGLNDESVSEVNPVIMGSTYGIQNDGIFNFYDGIITSTNYGITGIINNISDSYEVCITKNAEDKYETKLAMLEGVASVNGVEYNSLEEAMLACNDLNNTIILLQNIYPTRTINIDETKNIVLDLNGKNIYSYISNFIINNSGIFEITDNSEEQTGKITGYTPTFIKNGNSLTINGGTYYYSGNYQVKIIYNTGTGYINWINGKMCLKTEASIRQYGIYTDSIGDINIENIDFSTTGCDNYWSCSDQFMIFSTPSGTTTINLNNGTGVHTSNNGRIESHRYIIYDSSGKAIINVSGGDFNKSGNYTEYVVYQSNNNGGELNITGGNLNEYITHNNIKQVKNATILSLTAGSPSDYEIENSTITTLSNSGNTVIKNGTITTIQNYKNLTINGGTIGKITNGSTSKSTIQINGGTINNTNGIGVYNYSGSTVTLGKNDEDVSTTIPSITGSTYGIENYGTFNFYDGTITGQTKAIYGSVTNVPDQYKVSYSEDEKIATLDIIATAESIVSVGGIYYDTLQAAITAAAQSGEPVEVYKDIELTSSVIIAEGQTVTLNLKAHSITYTGINGAIINNGTLTITDIVEEEDSTEKNTSIIQNTSGPAITNNGTLTIGVDDGNVDTITPNIIGTPDAIENMGTLNLYDGLLNGEPVTVGTTTANITVYSLAKQTLLNTQNNVQEDTTGGETVNYMSVPTIKATPTLPTWTNDNVEVIIENSNRLILNVNNPQKGFDLALRKYITQINGQDVAESRAPEISEFTAQGILETNTGYYRHTKQALSVNKDDIVVYNISIYNEGTISGYASEIVDYLPSGLELIPDNEINIANGWQIASTDETGKATAIKTNILANRLIQASENTNTITNILSGSLSEAPYVQVVCKVVQEPSADKVYLTSRAEITAHKDENGNMYGKYFEEQEAENTDIDSTPNTIENNLNLSTWYAENVENFIPKIENYYEGVQDDDDFETVYIEEKTSVEGTKTWENTRYNENNLTVTIELYKDGIATGKTVETTKSKNWKYEFTNLSKYDREREIVYTVKEVKVMNGTEDVTNKFTVSYNGNNIKNTERVDIPVAKKWNVDNPEKYKAVFTLKKTVNGATEIAQELVDGNYVDATRAITGNGTATFENFEKYENGVKIIYSVEETLIQVAENSSQSTEYSGQETENNNQVNENSGQTWSDIPIENFIITNENGTTVNTLKKEVSKNKEWRRIENPDDYRATFKLYKLVEQDENSTESLEPVNDKEPVILTGNGTVKFSDLPAYEGTTEITYKIVEELAEYKSSVTSQWATLTKDYDYTETEEEGTIINTILEKKTAIGEKRWPNVPNSNLYKTTLGLFKVVNGEDLEVVDQSGVHKTQQIVGNGKITFTNLLKYNSENEEIEYKVKEIPNTAYYRLSEDSEEWIKLENYYTTITEEGIIENIVTTKAIKNKEWADVSNSNLYKATFGLYKVVNGQDVEVKDESNNQLTKAVIGNGTATFTNLQKYENGSEIKYKIKEIEVYYRLTEDDETWTKLEKTDYYVTDEGDTIVNKVIKQISITKTWNGVGNPDLYRATVVVNKIVDGTPVIATDITGTEITEQYIVGNNSVIFKNLPKYENGNEIRYEVEETNVKFRFTKLSPFVDMDLADFEVLVNEDGSIVNTRRTIETTQITKNKIWRVSDDVNNYRATFKLYKNINGEDIAVTEDADGSPIEEKTVIGNGQVEFANLVRYDENNKEIQYKIKETKIEKSGEQLNLTDFIITEQGNTIVNTEKTALEGTKKWEVQKYEEDKLTIKVELYKNGTATGNVKTVTLADNIKTETAVSTENTKTETVALTENTETETAVPTENTKTATTVTSTENWTYSFTDLPAYDENGANITYTIKEKQVIYNNEDVTNKFTVTYNGNNIKNTENLDIPVTKEWIGVKNAQLYRSTVILDKTVNGATEVATYADGSEVTEKTIIGNETVTFENLPKYEDGKLITYTPREISVSSRADEQSEFNETISLENFEITVQDGKITNKLIELSGTKTWELSKYEEQNLKVIIRLYKNGEATDKTQILTKETGWNYSFKELAAREGDVTNSYTVKEESVLYKNSTEDVDITNNFVIEYTGNNIKNIENVDCPIQKEWVGVEEALSYRAEFTLYKTVDGVESEVKGEDGNNITKVITGNNTDSFNNLPKYENGKEITYTAKETKIETTASTGDWKEFTSDKDWFEATVTKDKIVNRLLTKILVKEEWQNVEEENLHNYKVKLTLYKKLESGLQIAKDKNGNNVTSKEIIGNGTAEFTDLPKYENGERIVYVLKEEQASVNNGTKWDILNNNLYTIKYSTIEGIVGTDGEIKVVNIVEQTEQSVQIAWEDNKNQDGIRPEEIEVQLNANGSKYEVEGVENPVILN
ncbi:MAG: Cna B-type domain-containing protein, partial [Clostridia bacterium]|nr:Cna B-type domain-containing protein [Clostridia bacterium]